MVIWFMKSLLAFQYLLSLGSIWVSNRDYSVDFIFNVSNITEAVFNWRFYELSHFLFRKFHYGISFFHLLSLVLTFHCEPKDPLGRVSYSPEMTCCHCPCTRCCGQHWGWCLVSSGWNKVCFADVGGLAWLAQELFLGDRSNPPLLSTLRNQAKLKDV